MKYLNQIPGSWWTRIEQQSINGTPDTIGCIRGNFFALEFKSSDNAKVSALQRHNLSQITACGGNALIVTPQNWRDILLAIEFFSAKDSIVNEPLSN